MDKRIILAKAGAGKTYYICNDVKKEKRNIIVTYTNQNVKNICNELIKRFGYIPKDTIVMTFHSMMYKFMIRPFDILIGEHFAKEKFNSKGISIKEPPNASIKLNNGRRIRNSYYSDISKLEHYLDGKRYYSDLLSNLIIKINNRKGFSLIECGCNFLNNFFDYIYIDEVQDFREDNWKLIVEIINRVNNIVLVGDYYQHSVNALNNTGIPFKIKKADITYEQYIIYLKSLGLEVDEEILNKTRRCPKDSCEFITKKLNIDIECENNNIGGVLWIDESETIKNILNDDSVVKLVWDSAWKYKFNATTWGYSKGDTYKHVCIVLTDNLSVLKDENYLAPVNSTTNKLYVALTRSCGNTYILEKKVFDLFKEEFSK